MSKKHLNVICECSLSSFMFFYHFYWAAEQQTSWFIAPWWFCVFLWWICITFVWPSGSQKLTALSSRSERHLHFASIRLCLALLFIISILLFHVWDAYQFNLFLAYLRESIGRVTFHSRALNEQHPAVVMVLSCANCQFASILWLG